MKNTGFFHSTIAKLLNYQRVHPIKSHQNHHFPMVFLWFLEGQTHFSLATRCHVGHRHRGAPHQRHAVTALSAPMRIFAWLCVRLDLKPPVLGGKTMGDIPVSGKIDDMHIQLYCTYEKSDILYVTIHIYI